MQNLSAFFFFYSFISIVKKNNTKLKKLSHRMLNILLKLKFSHLTILLKDIILLYISVLFFFNEDNLGAKIFPTRSFFRSLKKLLTVEIGFTKLLTINSKWTSREIFWNLMRNAMRGTFILFIDVICKNVR